MPKVVRKPMAAMMTADWEDSDGETRQGDLAVVCDDGATFIFNWREDVWIEKPPIPGTVAAASKDADE